MVTAASWTAEQDRYGDIGSVRIRRSNLNHLSIGYLQYEAAVVVCSYGTHTGAVAGIVMSMESTFDAEMTVDITVQTSDRHPFRLPFIPDMVPLDPDWYRIQADYWEDRGDSFADPCRRFGEALAMMAIDRTYHVFDRSAVFSQRPARSLPGGR